jgi:porin
MRKSTFGRLVLVALCLTWTGAARVLAQAPNQIVPGPGSHSEFAADRYGVTSSASPFQGNSAKSAHPLFASDYPFGAILSGADAKAPANLGKPTSESDAAASTPAAPAPPSPPPFGGPCESRPKLTGDWCGWREELRHSGFTVDVSATTYYQGIASGGLTDIYRFGGRNDYWLNVDGEKAGLWQGLGITLHGETVYGDSVNLPTGAIVPVNIGRAHPVFIGDATALTAVKVTQALSENLVVFGGKINTIDNVQQPFMPGRGLDAGFMNAAFVWNPILGRTMNYATLGAGAAVLVGGQPVFTLSVYDTNNDSTTSGFDVLFNNGAIIYPTVTLPTTFFGMPGHQSLWGAYSSGRYAVVTPESLIDLSRVVQGIPPTTLVHGSWWITYLFDQALWVDPADQTRSWGVFGNAGISDGKPNPIKWSVIFGIAGSSPIPNRPRDTFGLACYYLGFSDDFKTAARIVAPLRDERGAELFYNVAVTPWCHITADLQVIQPAFEGAKTSLVLGLRAKIDF